MVCLFVVVDTAEDLLGSEEERGHFPDRELEVHLGEFEQPGAALGQLLLGPCS